MPALPADLRAEVAAGEASWTLALGPLVSDLDSADRLAIVGGDGIYELEEAEREVLASSDETRPLGVVRGGEPGRRLAESGVLEEIRSRLLARSRSRLAASHDERSSMRSSTRRRASSSGGRSVFTRLSRTRSPMRTRLELARSLSLWAAWCVAEDDEQAPIAAAAAKASAAEAAVQVCETAIQVHGGIGFTWEHVLHRLYKRALWIESFGASSTTLRAEVAASLLDSGTQGSGFSQTPVSLTQGG